MFQIATAQKLCWNLDCELSLFFKNFSWEARVTMIRRRVSMGWWLWRLTVISWKFSPRVFVHIYFCINLYEQLWFGGCLGLLLVKFRNIFRYKQVLRCCNVLKECFENVGTGFPVWRLFRSQRSMKISWNTKKKQDLKCLETFWQLIPVGIFDGWRWKITDLFWQLTVNPIKTFAYMYTRVANVEASRESL